MSPHQATQERMRQRYSVSAASLPVRRIRLPSLGSRSLL